MPAPFGASNPHNFCIFRTNCTFCTCEDRPVLRCHERDRFCVEPAARLQWRTRAVRASKPAGQWRFACGSRWLPSEPCDENRVPQIGPSAHPDLLLPLFRSQLRGLGPAGPAGGADRAGPASQRRRERPDGGGAGAGGRGLALPQRHSGRPVAARADRHRHAAGRDRRAC